MNAKEKREFRRLELEIEELKRHKTIAQNSVIDNFHSLYESRLALRQVHELLSEAEKIIRDVCAQDPAFMHVNGPVKSI